MKRKNRITPVDIIISILIAGAAIYIVFRVKVGLNYQWNWAVIPQYLWRYDEESGKWVANLLMMGVFNTIRLSFWGTILATIFGTVTGLCRVSQNIFFRLIGRSYVELIRNLPPLILIFIFYFFVSDQIMPVLHLHDFLCTRSDATQQVCQIVFAPPEFFSAFVSALVSLAIFEGAYITEIVRAGIQSVERGQWEACYALGLSKWHQMRHVILPQAMQRILPPLAGQFISLIKDSAIVSVISIQELTFQGMELMAATYLTFEIWITIALLYLIMTLTCSLAVERVEIHMAKNRR
ncbi:MAG: amino acid ABC transporter permease [Deltaproteobacteria bacterium]|nr:amino acid ABC transporter permease [Deltaproteobacteria bacterium]